MEKKIELYNSNNIKIGETYVRRARQLVNRQRARWVDSNQTAIRFYPEMENMDDGNMDDAVHEPIQVSDFSAFQLCFAPWSRGYYYPAIIDEVLQEHVRVTFLEDGERLLLQKEQIVELQEAFNTMAFEGNWQGGVAWFKGELFSLSPLIMAYNDGDMEHLSLIQLRAYFPQ